MNFCNSGQCIHGGLHPVIPSGVIIHYKRLGNDRLLLFPVAKVSGNSDGGVEIDLARRKIKVTVGNNGDDKAADSDELRKLI